VKEREKWLSVLSFIDTFFHYHKCKVEYIELRVMKVVLIRVIIGKK